MAGARRREPAELWRLSRPPEPRPEADRCAYGRPPLHITFRSSGQSRTMKDLVDDLCERLRRVDRHSRTWEVFLGAVEPDDETALRLSRTPLVPWPLVESLVQRIEIDLEDEDLVEQVDE